MQTCEKMNAAKACLSEHVASCPLRGLLVFLMQRARAFGIFDFVVFKITLVSIGLLLGSSFSSFFKKYRLFVLIGFLVSYCILIGRIFRCEKD